MGRIERQCAPVILQRMHDAALLARHVAEAGVRGKRLHIVVDEFGEQFARRVELVLTQA